MPPASACCHTNQQAKSRLEPRLRALHQLLHLPTESPTATPFCLTGKPSCCSPRSRQCCGRRWLAGAYLVIWRCNCQLPRLRAPVLRKRRRAALPFSCCNVLICWCPAARAAQPLAWGQSFTHTFAGPYHAQACHAGGMQCAGMQSKAADEELPGCLAAACGLRLIALSLSLLAGACRPRQPMRSWCTRMCPQRTTRQPTHKSSGRCAGLGGSCGGGCAGSSCGGSCSGGSCGGGSCGGNCLPAEQQIQQSPSKNSRAFVSHLL